MDADVRKAWRVYVSASACAFDGSRLACVIALQNSPYNTITLKSEKEVKDSLTPK